MKTVAETIREITRTHLLENNGVALGQCLTAVGWVGGTVPELGEKDGIIELSMADVAGGGIAVGYALAGRRPIYIVRYQGFQWYDCPIIINYAAKSKDMWGVPCPMFIRSIAMDGAIGPVAGGNHHSIYTRMPGIPVVAPMTPMEYRAVWEYFMAHNDPIYVSEHRRSFAVDYEFRNQFRSEADVVLFPISSTRLNTVEAVSMLREEGIVCSVVNLLWLNPFTITHEIKWALNNSKYGGLVIDGDFENGHMKCIAHDLMLETGKPVHVLGLEERSAGFAPSCDNLPPDSHKIYRKIKEIIARK